MKKRKILVSLKPLSLKKRKVLDGLKPQSVFKMMARTSLFTILKMKSATLSGRETPESTEDLLACQYQAQL